MTTVTWAWRSLRRHPLRTLLTILGIAVSGAMLLDMVMLSGGLERSFASLLLARGFQIRVTPSGTLPFDTDATITGADSILRVIRADRDVAVAGGVLGGALHARGPDSLLAVVGYGVEPDAQGLYQLLEGQDLAPQDSAGLLLGRPAAAALAAQPGDTVQIQSAVDPALGRAAASRRLVVRGIVRWLYDPRGQRSVGTTLAVMQALTPARQPDRMSVAMVKVRSGADASAVAARLGARLPDLQVSSVASLVSQFHERMVYFRQLASILASISLVVTVLLAGTLLTITVNERIGEIAALRAIGIRRRRVVGQVLAEGLMLALIGAILAAGLGLLMARYLDRILTSFPGLPAAFSFFVARPGALALSTAVLVASAALAGLYPAWRAAHAPIAATLHEEMP